MNNETNKQENLSETIKVSFENVAKVYEESSFLLKDLAAELEKLGFENLNGNEMSTRRLSKHIDHPRYWMMRFAALFFRPKDEQDSRCILSTNISYFDLEPKVMKPYLIVGVGDMVEGGKWGSPWMHHAFLNEKKMFIYYGADNKELKIASPKQEWQHQEDEWGFTVLGDKNYPDGLKAGKLFAVPLLEIKSEDVGKLAKRGSDLW